jgi:hypothetical protein
MYRLIKKRGENVLLDWPFRLRTTFRSAVEERPVHDLPLNPEREAA